MTDPAVYLQQRSLADMGHYRGRLDGVAGPATRAAMDAWLATLGRVLNVGTFEAMAATWGLRYFGAGELLTKGASNARLRLNTDPPSTLWPAIKNAALAADEARHRLGSGILIASAYRSPAYNRAVGGAANSFHVRFRALDLRPVTAGIARLHAILRDLRDEGYPGCAGIGRYATFCHIDDGPTRDF